MAQLTIIVPDAHVPRVLAAIGYHLDSTFPKTLPAVAATPAEARQVLALYLKKLVRDYKVALARYTAEAGIVDITPTP